MAKSSIERLSGWAGNHPAKATSVLAVAMVILGLSREIWRAATEFPEVLKDPKNANLIVARRDQDEKICESVERQSAHSKRIADLEANVPNRENDITSLGLIGGRSYEWCRGLSGEAGTEYTGYIAVAESGEIGEWRLLSSDQEAATFRLRIFDDRNKVWKNFLNLVLGREVTVGIVGNKTDAEEALVVAGTTTSASGAAGATTPGK
ncbi:MAG: hypothetical protein WC846_02280 [Candidatus Gracilibacteria bacterium]|jgi:hypothetical protein